MNKTLSLLSACILGTGVMLTSCSEDTLENLISIPEGIPNEISLGYYNGVQSIPLQANGDWKATVIYDGIENQEDAPEWLALLTEGGKGNGTVDYVVDVNNTPRLRSARIKVESGDKSIEYKVNQQPVGFGENNENLDMSMFGTRIPLGYGIRMRPASSGDDNTINMLTSQIIVVDGLSDPTDDISAIIKNLGLRPNKYVRSDTTTNVKMDVVSKEACDSTSRLVGADLKVTVAYGLFKLNLNGNFRMFGESDGKTYNFSALSIPNKGIFTIDESVLLDDLETLADNKNIDAVKRAEKRILSSSFIKVRDDIEQYVANGQKYTPGSTDMFNRKLRALDNQFGPAFIRAAAVGASAELNYNLTKQQNIDTLKIHGDLTFGLNSLFSLNVNAAADYNNHMKSYMEESAFSCRIKGGSASAADDMARNLAKLMTSNATVTPETVTEKILDWSKTVNTQNATCISYYPTPIWTLFSDEAAEEIKKYFWYAYPNIELGNNEEMCPYTFDVRKQINNEGGLLK